MPDITLTLTGEQHDGLTREATVLQFDSPDALALRLVTDAAHRGMATLRAEQDAAFNAKRFVYEKADPKMTKEQIEAAYDEAKAVVVVGEGVAGPEVVR